MNLLCIHLIIITQISHLGQSALSHLPEPRAQNVEKGIPFGKMCPRLPEVETHPAKLPAHLDEVRPHFVKLLAHLGEVSPHIDKLLAHLGGVSSHFDKLLVHLDEVSPHLAKLSAPFGGFSAENEPLRQSALALRGFSTAQQAEAVSLQGCCGGLLARFFYTSSPRQEVALIS